MMKVKSCFLYNLSRSCFHFFFFLSLFVIFILKKSNFVEDSSSQFHSILKRNHQIRYLPPKIYFSFSNRKMDQKIVRSNPRNNDITAFDEEFRFQPETEGSSRG